MFIGAPDESTVEGDVAEWYQRQRDAWGYLPNYAAAFATRPDVAEAWNTLNNADPSTTWSGGGSSSPRSPPLAPTAPPTAWRPTPSSSVTTCGDESTMRALAADPSGANLDAADRAVVDFATQVAQDAASITADDVQQLRDQGLNDPRSSMSRSRPPRERSSPRCSTRSVCRPTRSSARRSIPRSGAR